MKNILLLILFPLLVFSQHSRNMKGEKKADARIIDLLENYGKAYEYEDFESVANYFDYPTTFKSPIGNSILKDKEELIKFYKVARSAEVVGDDYLYSLYKKINPIWINKDLCIMDAFYNRYGKKYNLVHKGRRFICLEKRKMDGKFLM